MNTHPWWADQGYLLGKCINEEADLWICLAPMLYTWRLMICDQGTVYGFACYEDIELACSAFAAWDGQGLPLDGYTRTVSLTPALAE